MFETLLGDDVLYKSLCDCIVELKGQGVYNGGYEAVRLAVKGNVPP